MSTRAADECVSLFKEEEFRIQLFMDAVRAFFALNPALNGDPAVVHSTKSRMKDPKHLHKKIQRKNEEEPGDPITAANFFARVTDLAGVRILHLHQQQFVDISRQIERQLQAREWALHEQPKAYTWDPEASRFFQSLGLKVELKESMYTSVHYVVRPREDSPISCEIQIRTLFEEIWGEIDHQLNYPEKCGNVACVEQLRVLSKLVGAGSRLGDAIFRTYREWLETLKAVEPRKGAEPDASVSALRTPPAGSLDVIPEAAVAPTRTAEVRPDSAAANEPANPTTDGADSGIDA